MTAALVAGVLAGLGVAIPVGAVGTYLVALTARTSLRIGAFAALGVATADGLYAVIAVAGGSAIGPVLQPIVTPLRWGSAVVLVAVAARTSARAIRQYRDHESTQRIERTPIGAGRAYLGLLGMTLLNPTTAIYFAALVLGSQATAARGQLESAVFIGAATAASACWQLFLACGGALLGHLVTGRRGRLLTAVVSSVLIGVLAVHLVR